LANLTKRLAIIDPAKVDGADLGDELRVKLLEFKRHRSRDRLTVNGESNVPTCGLEVKAAPGVEDGLPTPEP
jgi:hypothetical protein